MAILTRDEILGCSDLREEVVPVPEWGGEVRVRGMDGASRDRYEASLWVGGRDGRVDMTNHRAKLVAFCAVGEDGRPLFSQEDVEALGRKSGVALERVADIAERLSGLNAGAAEEARGN